MKRIKNSWVMAAVVVFGSAAWLLSGQLGAAPERKQGPRQADAETTQELPAVRVIESVAAPRDEIVRLFGHTEAWRKVDVRSEIDGRIVELPVARGHEVRAGDVVARIATDDKAARLKEAQALLKQRQIEFEATQQLSAKGHRSETQLAEAVAKLDSARAMTKRIEVEIGQTTITAPFEGVLNDRPVELGGYVKAGDKIGMVVDLDPLRIVGYVIEHNVARLRKGMQGEAALGNGIVLRGTVAMVGVVADAKTRTFRIELEVPNPDNGLVDGLTAELRVPVGQTMAHKLSPALLALSDDGSVGVKIVSADAIVSFARITLVGNTPDGAVYVTGLPERATVISVGQDYVGVGQKVKPVPAGPRESVSR